MKAQEPESPTQKSVATEAAAAVGKKLDEIVIPSIGFQDTALNEGIDFLRLRSNELDKDPSSVGKGVNFVVRRPRSGTGNLDPGDTRIDLALKNISLRQAIDIDAICSNSGLSFEVNDCAQATQTTLQATDSEIRFILP